MADIRLETAAIAALDISPEQAVMEILALLVSELPVHGASAWVSSSDGGAVPVGESGEVGEGETFAGRVLAGDVTEPVVDGELAGVRVVRSGSTVGALLLFAEPGEAERCARALPDAADAAAATLERRGAPAVRHERELAAASERLLLRLGFDLHDGPLQQVYVLAQDVRLLRDQLDGLLEQDHRQLVLGRFADLESELAELHQDLRDLAHSLEPRSLLQQPLPDAIRRELDAFERRTSLATSLAIEGSLDALTPSQRIALLRVLQEGLSNVRQHSGAGAVSVTLIDDGDGVRMELEDDGHGFDPASTGERDGGGIGLVGMRERLRLLGGRLEVRSAPGGPTVVAAALPRWLTPT